MYQDEVVLHGLGAVFHRSGGYRITLSNSNRLVKTLGKKIEKRRKERSNESLLCLAIRLAICYARSTRHLSKGRADVCRLRLRRCLLATMPSDHAATSPC
jgi:hypothetical protein